MSFLDLFSDYDYPTPDYGVSITDYAVNNALSPGDGFDFIGSLADQLRPQDYSGVAVDSLPLLDRLDTPTGYTRDLAQGAEYLAPVLEQPNVPFDYASDLAQGAEYLAPVLEQPQKAWYDELSDTLDNVEDWMGSHKNLLSLGAGALSLLTSIPQARAIAEARKRQLAIAEKNMAARNAALAAANAPWSPTPQRRFIGLAPGQGTSGYGLDSTNFRAAPNFSSNNAKFAKGGLSALVVGRSCGQDDKVPAMLSDGEFVIPADVVSHLGDGNTNAGADKLYRMIESVRKQKGAKPKKLPPKSRSNAIDYVGGKNG